MNGACIQAYGYALGRYVRSVDSLVPPEAQSLTPSMEELGLRFVPTAGDEPLEALILRAFRAMNSSVDVLYVAHSTPIVRRSYSVELESRLGVPTFFLSGVPCAIMHSAIELACSELAMGTYKSVGIIGADRAYTDHERTFFGTAMGDSALAVTVTRGGTRHHIVASYNSTNVVAPHGENSGPDAIQRFRSTNVIAMRSAFRECLARSGFMELDYVIPHTANSSFWDVFAEATGIDRRRILDQAMPMTGHMNSHDSFYHYFKYCEDGVLMPGARVILANPGFGGSHGCTAIAC